MLSIPPRTALPLPLSRTLLAYLEGRGLGSPNAKETLKSLEILRSEATAPPALLQTQAACHLQLEKLSAYKNQLENPSLLTQFFPFSSSHFDSNGIKLLWTWSLISGANPSPHTAHLNLSSYDVQFEIINLIHHKACILSHLATIEWRVSSGGAGDNMTQSLKRAASYFQRAAGTLEDIWSSFNSSLLKEAHFEKDNLNAFFLLMLAQAQECFLQKAEQSSTSPSLLLKLSSSTTSLFSQVTSSAKCLEKLVESSFSSIVLLQSSNEQKELLLRKSETGFLKSIFTASPTLPGTSSPTDQSKQLLLAPTLQLISFASSRTLYYQIATLSSLATIYKGNSLWGKEISCLQAMKQLIQTSPPLPIVSGRLKEIESKLNIAINDNTLIYNDFVPSQLPSIFSLLEECGSIVMVKAEKSEDEEISAGTPTHQIILSLSSLYTTLPSFASLRLGEEMALLRMNVLESIEEEFKQQFGSIRELSIKYKLPERIDVHCAPLSLQQQNNQQQNNQQHQIPEDVINLSEGMRLMGGCQSLEAQRIKIKNESSKVLSLLSECKILVGNHPELPALKDRFNLATSRSNSAVKVDSESDRLWEESLPMMLALDLGDLYSLLPQPKQQCPLSPLIDPQPNPKFIRLTTEIQLALEGRTFKVEISGKEKGKMFLESIRELDDLLLYASSSLDNILSGNNVAVELERFKKEELGSRISLLKEGLSRWSFNIERLMEEWIPLEKEALKKLKKVKESSDHGNGNKNISDDGGKREWSKTLQEIRTASINYNHLIDHGKQGIDFWNSLGKEVLDIINSVKNSTFNSQRQPPYQQQPYQQQQPPYNQQPYQQQPYQQPPQYNQQPYQQPPQYNQQNSQNSQQRNSWDPNSPVNYYSPSKGPSHPPY